MFGKEKTREFEAPAVTKSSSKDIKTLIGEGCKVEGNFFIPTYTRIDGTVKGDLTGDSGIVIGVNGRVEGNVVSPEIVNYGHIQGNVEAQRLELKKGSSTNGDIAVIQLLTELGSLFNGKCAMIESPRQESIPVEAQETSEEQ